MSLLLRVLVPTWRFFDRVVYTPSLFYRIKVRDGAWGEWKNAFQKPTRVWSSLFLNSEENAYLAKCSILERVIEEVNEGVFKNEVEIEHSVSYGLLKKNVEQSLLSQKKLTNIIYQFKVEAVFPKRDKKNSEVVLLSKEHEY